MTGRCCLSFRQHAFLRSLVSQRVVAYEPRVLLLDDSGCLSQGMKLQVGFFEGKLMLKIPVVALFGHVGIQGNTC